MTDFLNDPEIAAFHEVAREAANLPPRTPIRMIRVRDCVAKGQLFWLNGLGEWGGLCEANHPRPSGVAMRHIASGEDAPYDPRTGHLG